jgi:hypothetical protein
MKKLKLRSWEWRFAPHPKTIPQHLGIPLTAYWHEYGVNFVITLGAPC